MLEGLRSWVTQKIAPQGMALGVIPSGQYVAPKRGTAALLEAYTEMPWLRAVVGKVGRLIGSTVWTLHVATGSKGRAIRRASLGRAYGAERRRGLHSLRRQGNLRDIESHPLLDLLGHGNDHLPGNVVLQIIQQHLDLVGEGLLVKTRGGLNQPTDLWPIPPSWIWHTPFLSDEGTDGFKLQHRSWSMDVPTRDAVWLLDPDVANPYGRGSGAARSLSDELEADEFAAKHILSFFRNSARPDLVVSLESGAVEDVKRLESRWLEKFSGVFNRRRPLFTAGGKIDVKEIGQTFQEMQLVPLRQHERDCVISVYGVPPEIFGIIENSNRATIDGAGYLLAKYVLEPRQEMLRTFLQEYLVPDFDERLILNFVSPVEEDQEHKRAVYATAPWAFQVDEHRALGGESELPNGRGKLHPLPFTVTFGEITETLPEEMTPTPPAEDDEDILPEDDDTDDDTDDDNDETVPNTRRVTRRRRAVERSFDQSSLAILLGTIDDRRVKRSVWGISAVHASEIAAEFGQRMLDEIGAKIEWQATARVAEFQRNWATDRSRLIDATTKTQLKQVLSQAIEDGSSPQEMVDGIRSVYSDATRSRAFLIARTETTRASNFGQQESFIQAGVEQKEWLATRDDHVRESHVSLDGQVVDARAPFVIPDGQNAGSTAQYPGDFGIAEEDINCRCSSVSVFEETGRSIYDTEDKRVKAWKAYESYRITAERGFRPVIRRSFNEQRDIVLAKFRELAKG